MKTLVAYYSQSGQTKKYAEIIAKKFNADKFKIEPVRPYNEDMWDAWDEAQIERKNNSIRDIKTSLPNISEYDLIILGTGVWGYTMSNPMFKFIESLDFSNKITSGFWTFYDHDEKINKDMKNKLKNSNYRTGLPIPRSLRNEEEAINKWIETLKEEI